ncbi:MAG: TRAP transporter substrate-binding protein DctP [Betaproteobacteria bacterium]|nr:TRAP transporter substrate-binding protein DctP [Betaproteobacteria bacterium]
MADAAAQETFTLKFATGVPATHFISQVPAKFFMDRVGELSKGRIKFEFYPGEQLGKAKDMLLLVQTGVSEMADIVPSYVPDKLPLTGVTELPGQSANACEGTRVYYNLTRPGKILATKTFDPQKVRVLMAANIVPYKIVTSKKAVYTLEDLAGLKIRTTGGATDDTMRALGAVSVRLSGAEIREAATRGTIDGALYTHECEVVRIIRDDQVRYRRRKPRHCQRHVHHQRGEVQADSPICRRFSSKPARRQENIIASGWMRRRARRSRRLPASSRSSLPRQRSRRWQVRLDAAKQEWVTRMDKRGSAGSGSDEGLG